MGLLSLIHRFLLGEKGESSESEKSKLIQNLFLDYKTSYKQKDFLAAQTALKKLHTIDDDAFRKEYYLSLIEETNFHLGYVEAPKQLPATSRKISYFWCEEEGCRIPLEHNKTCELCGKHLCWLHHEPRFHKCVRESVPSEGGKPGVVIDYSEEGWRGN